MTGRLMWTGWGVLCMATRLPLAVVAVIAVAGVLLDRHLHGLSGEPVRPLDALTRTHHRITHHKENTP